MILWLLEKATFQEMREARNAGMIPTVEQEDKWATDCLIAENDLPRIMSVAGSSAAINITGVLTDSPSFFARWFGGGNTTYSEIITSIAMAENDPSITDIILNTSSPGGQASAEWVAAMDAINAAKKPVTAIVGSMAASAAYGLASQANTIVAQNRMSVLGSVGVVSTHFIEDDVVEITSSNAPDKRPDVQTEEGKATVRDFIDQMESVFISAIARGRNEKEKTIKSDFGRGGVMLANDALERNMIDSISNSDNSQTQTAATSTAQTKNKESVNMDLTQLKADHPAVYQAAVNEGVVKGESTERDRVNAHLILGEASGDLKTALAAVEDGSPMTETIRAKYTAAGMKRDDQTALVVEDEGVGAATANTNSDDDDTDAQDMELAKAVVANMGGTA